MREAHRCGSEDFRPVGRHRQGRAIENAKKLVEGIKADFKEFIPVVTTEGASVAKPPAGDGGTAAPKNLRDALHERYEQKG